MKKIFFLLLIGCFTSFGQNQSELPKIVPLSPNAASIAKYGEIPVGHFTGTPNINIPIYEIKSGDLSIPLSLSYHGAGNKVEDIASWVGLGWSLNIIPIISRSVRGLPDEQHYFTNPSIRDLYINRPNTTQFRQILSLLNAGEYDSEPDVFSYVINGESGKFFYNQELEEFVTTPVSNIKIIKEGTADPAFKIISQEGTEYTFSNFNKEQSNQVGLLGPNPPLIATSWRVSKIKSANAKDSITFSYTNENQRQRIIVPKTKLQWLDGVPVDHSFLTSSPFTLWNNNNTKRLAIINFKNGSVEFIENTSTREDLEGAHSLRQIIVRDNQGKQINKFDFNYRYVTRGSGCPLDDSYSKNWLMLDQFINNSSSLESLEHSFEYDEKFPPCRNSFAQDHWGYYNGELQNQDLIPPASVPNSNVQIPGANRNVNPSFSQFGILKKIIYPTKGFTEFDYENNQVQDSSILPQNYVEDFSFIESDYDPDDPNWPTTNIYTETLTLNNPPDFFLNNNNPDGGAFVTFQIGFPGCDISQGANACARFTVKKISSGDPAISYDLHLSSTRFHLPNGTYEIKAEFNQPTPQYQSFFFMAKWDKVVESQSQSNNRNVGGLRIKEIRGYSNNNPGSKPIIKRYKYISDYNSTESSGLLFNVPEFNYSDIVTIYNETVYDERTIVLDHGFYLRRRGTNNIQQISHSGSFVGYKTIIEETENPYDTGVTIYNYTHVLDEPFENGFPFSPAASNEIYRGQISEIYYYKKIENSLSLVKSIENEYLPTLDVSTYNPFKSSFALKTGKNVLFPASIAPGYLNLIQEDSEPDAIVEYEISSEWSNISKTVEKEYFKVSGSSGDSIIQNKTTNYYYDNIGHLQPTRTETTTSRGKLLTSLVSYPEDIPSPTLAEQELISQNKVSVPIQTINTVEDSNGNIMSKSTQYIIYKDWGSNIILPERVQGSKGDDQLENRILYHKYDNRGNPIEISKANGSHIVYLWGYNKEYAIAKIENTTFSEVATTLNISEATLKDYNESNILHINGLRQTLPNAMINTYAYNPLIGVTSITDPRGYVIYYEYDDLNRLEYIRDADGNLISENKYYHKNQN